MIYQVYLHNGHHERVIADRVETYDNLHFYKRNPNYVAPITDFHPSGLFVDQGTLDGNGREILIACYNKDSWKSVKVLETLPYDPSQEGETGDTI